MTTGYYVKPRPSLVWVPPVYPETSTYRVLYPANPGRRMDRDWAKEVFLAMRCSNFGESTTRKNRRRRRRQGRLTGPLTPRVSG